MLAQDFGVEAFGRQEHDPEASFQFLLQYEDGVFEGRIEYLSCLNFRESGRTHQECLKAFVRHPAGKAVGAADTPKAKYDNDGAALG